MKFQWTEELDNFLKNNFYEMQYKELEDKIGCKRYQVKVRAGRLGLIKNVWSEEQDEFLKNNIHLKNRELAVLLNKGLSAVNSRIAKNDLSRKVKEPNWTDKEYEFLKSNYGIITCEEIGKHLGRTKASIAHKAMEFNLRRHKGLTQEQKDFIENEGKKLSKQEIADKLGTTYYKVKKYRKKTKAYRDNFYVTDEEIEYVRQNIDLKTDTELARDLNVTEGKIRAIISFKITERRKMPYIIAEKNVGQMLIDLLGLDRVRSNYNEGTGRTRAIKYSSVYVMQCSHRIKRLSSIEPDYELLHPDKGWIPSEYFGFGRGGDNESRQEYEQRKRLKKCYLKHLYGKTFVSFNVFDLRKPELVEQKLIKAGYLI